MMETIVEEVTCPSPTDQVKSGHGMLSKIKDALLITTLSNNNNNNNNENENETQLAYDTFIKLYGSGGEGQEGEEEEEEEKEEEASSGLFREDYERGREDMVGEGSLVELVATVCGLLASSGDTLSWATQRYRQRVIRVHVLHTLTPATPHTCYTSHLLHLTPATPHTCYTSHLLHLTPATPHTCYTSHLLHLTRATPHTCYTSHLLHLTRATPHTFYTSLLRCVDHYVSTAVGGNNGDAT
ncbi:hypothetical protein Hamer_G016705 [Homarus americanus]|uniref:Uncharacterized protein n=1 Tax=Homarus americanus TaxID=6706 RepID=A0A8J5NDR8_HOMAM|nr:hypothetical protein Hamer_G016705 [Homarus americanus]